MYLTQMTTNFFTVFSKLKIYMVLVEYLHRCYSFKKNKTETR